MSGATVGPERELKLRPRDGAEARAVLDEIRSLVGVALVDRGARHLLSRYLDTDGFDLARCGLGVRARGLAEGEQARWTVKLSLEAREGTFSSTELEVDGTYATVPAAIAGRLRKLVGASKLHEIARIANRRTTLVGIGVEVALDEVAVIVPREQRFIEIEVESGDVQLLQHLADALVGVERSDAHKLGVALGREFDVDAGCRERAARLLLAPEDPAWQEEPAPWTR
jgi:inorganic triphosphatase YgiF